MIDKVKDFLKNKIWESGIIDTKDISFKREVVKMCEMNTCGNYNNSWTCPPAIGSIEKLSAKILSYKKAYVFTTKFDLEDSFDYEGMMAGGARHDEITAGLHELFGVTMPVYGAGGCRICGKCNFPEPCVHPDKIFPSVEACGIYVTDLAAAAGIKYHNGENTITYFGMVLFNGE